MTASMRHPALSYAGLGWPVFRCRRGGKAPATRHGFRDATADVDRVDDEFTRHPHANIGMPTGVVWDVLDLDVKPSGVNARQLVPRLMDGGWLSGAAGLAETRNGGLHVYYPASGLPSGSIPHLGVDFKAGGGYVLLPPSRVPSDFPERSGTYRWARFPTDSGIALDWPRLRAELDPRPDPATGRVTSNPGGDTSRRLAGLCRTVEQACEGNRNRALFWAACQARAAGLLDAPARAALTGAARAAGLPGWEAERTIASAARAAGGG